MVTSQEFLEHLSEKPWSMYTAADYTLAQWHNACLIHNHTGTGADYSKSDCKLPIKTPSGAVNRNGVYSAAAALAGARGGVNASPEQKSSAAKTLIRLYNEMNKKPPPSLVNLAHDDELSDFFEHHGVKGQRWGVRRRSSGGSAGKGSVKKKGKTQSAEHKKIAELKKRKTPQLTNKQLKAANERMNLEQNYNRMNPTMIARGAKHYKAIVGTLIAAKGLHELVNSKSGKAFISLAKKTLQESSARTAAAKIAKTGQLKLPGV